VDLLDLFKLEKLKITAFKDALRKDAVPDMEFEAMFNPATYSETYALVLGKKQGVNASGAAVDYAYTKPSELTLDLVLDGTGVDEMGISLLGAPQTVKDRVKKFRQVTHDYDGDLHEPYYLKVAWGTHLVMDCRLSKVDIKYTKFERNGDPLRAVLTVKLVSDIDPKRRSKLENKKSPDVTHARIVRSGDTLPLLTKDIYGSSSSYLDVARFNDLDDFRNLIPGRQLLFPPLAQLGGAAASRRK
jgi:nucleoid-associated protein YgaU